MSHANSVKFVLLSAVACALCAVASCSQDGVTTNCPPLPLYQTYALGDASPPNAMTGDSAAAKQAFAAAVNAGCATAPGGGSSGISAGGASGGKTGSAGKGGSSADSAGAAGSN